MTIHTITVDGLTSRVWRAGGGNPLLYLHSEHGEVGDFPIFQMLAAAGHAVLVPEIAGFGQSDPAPDWHRVEDAVYHLRRVLDELKVDLCTLVGASFGGWLAAELAVWFPERFSALVLVDAMGLHVDGSPMFDIFAGRGDAGVDLPTILAPAWEANDDPAAPRMHAFRAAEATARIGWNPYLHDPRLAGRLPAVTAPTLVLWGANDAIVPVEHGSEYARRILGAQLEILPGIGHLPTLQCPAIVVGAITRHGARTSSAR